MPFAPQYIDELRNFEYSKALNSYLEFADFVKGKGVNERQTFALRVYDLARTDIDQNDLLHLRALNGTIKGPVHIKEQYKQFADAVECSIALRNSSGFQSIRNNSLRQVDLKDFSKDGSVLINEVDKIRASAQRTPVATQLKLQKPEQVSELAKFERLSAVEKALNEYMADLKLQLKDLYEEYDPPSTNPLATSAQYNEAINSVVSFAGRYSFDQERRPQLPRIQNSDPKNPSLEVRRYNSALPVTLGLCTSPRFESRANKLLFKINTVGQSLNFLKERTEITRDFRHNIRQTVDTCRQLEPSLTEKKLLDILKDLVTLKPVLQWLRGSSTDKLSEKTEEQFRQGPKPGR